VDPALFRPAEIEVLVGDASRARERLGWQPRVPFEELIGMMVDHDIAILEARGPGETGFGRRGSR
jgi:GDPmannose 4,6-dehydratase